MTDNAVEMPEKMTRYVRLFRNFWSNVSNIKLGPQASPQVCEAIGKEVNYYHGQAK